MSRNQSIREWNGHHRCVLFGWVFGDMTTSSHVSRNQDSLVSTNEPRLIGRVWERDVRQARRVHDELLTSQYGMHSVCPSHEPEELDRYVCHR